MGQLYGTEVGLKWEDVSTVKLITEKISEFRNVLIACKNEKIEVKFE